MRNCWLLASFLIPLGSGLILIQPAALQRLRHDFRRQSADSSGTCLIQEPSHDGKLFLKLVAERQVSSAESPTTRSSLPFLQ